MRRRTYNAPKLGETLTFNYTGTSQSITLPAGKYKIECWGASGGDVRTTNTSYYSLGGVGGHTVGILNLTTPKKLFLFVGGKGENCIYSSDTSFKVLKGGWNGGMATIQYQYVDNTHLGWKAAGGGATDVAVVDDTLVYDDYETSRSTESLLSRFIVAGGGSGAGYYLRSGGNTILDYVNGFCGGGIDADNRLSSANWRIINTGLHFLKTPNQYYGCKTREQFNELATTTLLSPGNGGGWLNNMIRTFNYDQIIAYGGQGFVNLQSLIDEYSQYSNTVQPTGPVLEYGYTEHGVGTEDGNGLITITPVGDNYMDEFTNGHEYVDLGLPSGTLWSVKYLGASDTDHVGTLYMANGEPYVKNATVELNDYSIHPNEEEDIIRREMGGAWRMPTTAQVKELQTYCDIIHIPPKGSYHTTDDPQKLVIIRKTNDNYLIVPIGNNYNKEMGSISGSSNAVTTFRCCNTDSYYYYYGRDTMRDIFWYDTSSGVRISASSTNYASYMLGVI